MPALAERADERGLADPRLARDEHEPAAAVLSHGVVAGLEQFQLCRALQERHGTILAGTSQPRKRAAYSPASPVSSKWPRRARRRIWARVNASMTRRGASRSSA